MCGVDGPVGAKWGLRTRRPPGTDATYSSDLPRVQGKSSRGGPSTQGFPQGQRGLWWDLGTTHPWCDPGPSLEYGFVKGEFDLLDLVGVREGHGAKGIDTFIFILYFYVFISLHF